MRRRTREPDRADQDHSGVRHAQGRSAVHPLLELQRSAGNQAVARALAGRAAVGRRMLFRHFDNFAPTTQQEQGRKARFEAFVDRAVTAGISLDVAEGAGAVTLQRWEGWSDPRLPDFDHAWINGPAGFRTKLHAKLEAQVAPGPLKALLDAIFAANADDAQLRRLGQAAGFQPGVQQPQQQVTLNLDPEWEREFLDVYGAQFEDVTTGEGRAFRLAWERASAAHKHRILDIIIGPGWAQEGHITPSAHLSSMEYVIEGVCGITGTPANIISSWARNPIGSLFDHVKTIGGGYQTKYMTAAERKDYKLDVSGGRAILPTGEPLKGDNIYVLAVDGFFYGGAKKSGRDGKQTSEAIHHSTFMGGEPVDGAGHFVTDDSGTILKVDDQSGHYRPGDYELGFVLYYLEQYGTALSRVTINRRVPAEKFLADWKLQYMPEQSTQGTEEKVTVNQ